MPIYVTGDYKQEQARATILDNRRKTIRDIATRLGISQGSAPTTIHDILGYHKVCARWVPTILAEGHKRCNLESSFRILEQYRNEGKNFLNCIAGDETGSTIMTQKANTGVCSGSTQHLLHERNSKHSHQLEGLFFTVFWDCQGPILEHYQEK
jgi:hypothetical protein